MNSAQLIDQHKHIYKDFFNKYDLIISTPLHFPIVGDTAIYSQGNNTFLAQKLTFRNYIGINFTKSDDKIRFFYKKNSEFEESNIDLFYPIDRTLFKKIGLDYDIGILSEYNWIDPASMILNIILVKLIKDGEIGISDLEHLDIESDKNKEIIKKIVELDQKLMLEQGFFSINRNNSNFTLSSLLKSRSHMLVLEKNYDTSVLNIGNNHSFNQMDMSISLLNPNTFVERNYNPKILLEKNKLLENYINTNGIVEKNFQDTNLLNGLEIISNHYAIKTFQNIHMLYENILQTNFFNDLYSYRQAIRAIFCDFNNIKLDIRQIKNTIINMIGDPNSKIYLDLVGVSGSVRVVLFTNKNGNIDENLIKKINAKLGTYFSLDYSSYYDGFEIDGSKLEQYKSMNIISPLSSGNTITTVNNKGKSVITSEYEDALNDKLGGILLDKLSKKIYIDGVKLTSQELHSQTFTIELLEILIENIGKFIDNKQLPLGSYSKNKNELVGKIIMPLNKLLEEKIGKKLPLTCSGSLGEYLIKLDETDIKISILKPKINQL